MVRIVSFFVTAAIYSSTVSALLEGVNVTEETSVLEDALRFARSGITPSTDHNVRIERELSALLRL